MRAIIAFVTSMALSWPSVSGLTFSSLQSRAIHAPSWSSPSDNRIRIQKSSTSLYLSKKYQENVVEKESTSVLKSPTVSTDGDSNVNGNNLVATEKNGAQILEEGKLTDRTLGILVLLTVPLAWGTYTPVVKYMYEKMDPSMPGFVFSAGYYLVAAASLGILSNMQDNNNKATMRDESNNNGGVAVEGDVTIMDGSDDETRIITTRGGWELGSYLFIGNGLQVVGLQTVPADRAAFLVQLTTVMVPIFFAISMGNLSAVPIQTWIACIIAFAGVIIIGADDGGSASSISAAASDATIIDGTTSATAVVDQQHIGSLFDSIDLTQLSNSFQISQGDFLICLAAISYTMHVVRLGAYAPRTTPLKLAASKAKTEAILSVILVIGLAFIGSTDLSSPQFVSETGHSVSEYFQTITSAFTENGLAPSNAKESSLGVSIAAILWTGWVTCAYTIYAQSFGQSRVNPTDSNLIYTTQPLFSSAFAYVLLGETLGFYGFVGALMIGTALWLVSSSGNE